MKNTKKLTLLGMLTAAAYLVMLLVKIPVGFLSLEPKDAVLAVTGFMFGPAEALAVTALVAFIEMCTVSGTGIIGLAMNLLSSGFFACTAAAVYKKRRTLKGAVTGLVLGTLVMAAMMVLWNYIITPLYMKVPRAEVAGMLMTLFLPFNLLKGALNSAVCVLVYKPLSKMLRGFGLAPATERKPSGVSRTKVIVLSLLVLAIAAAGVILLKKSL